MIHQMKIGVAERPRSINTDKAIEMAFCPVIYYSKKNWMVGCGPLPKTLALFKTQICYFPLPYL